MSRSRRKTYHHGDLRRALLEVARELIESEGPEALTFRRLAEAVEVSHAAPLAHFPDRLSLDAALATLGFQELRQRCEQARAPLGSPAAHFYYSSAPNPPAPAAALAAGQPVPRAPTPARRPAIASMRLVTAALVYLRFALEHPGLFRMMHQPRLADRISETEGELPDSLQELLQEKAAAFAIFVELVRQGQERGELKRNLAPDQIARLVTALVEGLAHQYLEEKLAPGQDRLQDAERLLTLLTEGFAELR